MAIDPVEPVDSVDDLRRPLGTKPGAATWRDDQPPTLRAERCDRALPIPIEEEVLAAAGTVQGQDERERLASGDLRRGLQANRDGRSRQGEGQPELADLLGAAIEASSLGEVACECFGFEQQPERRIVGLERLSLGERGKEGVKRTRGSQISRRGLIGQGQDRLLDLCQPWSQVAGDRKSLFPSRQHLFPPEDLAAQQVVSLGEPGDRQRARQGELPQGEIDQRAGRLSFEQQGNSQQEVGRDRRPILRGRFFGSLLTPLDRVERLEVEGHLIGCRIGEAGREPQVEGLRPTPFSRGRGGRFQRKPGIVHCSPRFRQLEAEEERDRLLKVFDGTCPFGRC